MSITDPAVARCAEGIDPDRWPDLARVPPGRLRRRIAWALFRRVVNRSPLQVRMPDGTHFGAGGPGDPIMRLQRPEAFARRVGHSGLIGFGEAWMARDWEADDLTGVLTVFAHQISTLVPPRLQRLRDRVLPRHPGDELATLAGARNNVSRHYDLSNELFASFLDPTLTYSSALFPGTAPFGATFAGLGEAQQAKIDRLLDGVGVGPGTSLLEIGTGWGELAIRAARRGALVHTITLSESQRDLARRRVRHAGLDDRVTIELCDYRHLSGVYDAVISVEMVEAVGAAFWPEYFRVLDRHTRPGGRVGLQAITMPHDRMRASRDTYTWIHKYIFPGGLCPSVEAIDSTMREHTGLLACDRFSFGLHYAETLRLWRSRFESRAPALAALGFDPTFRRMWTLYLAYSEAGFRSGYLDVHQFLFAKG